MGNATGREEDAAAAEEGADVEDGGGDSSTDRGFPPYGGGGNHVPRACSVGVVGASGGPGSPPGSPGRSLSPRMFVPQQFISSPLLPAWDDASPLVCLPGLAPATLRIQPMAAVEFMKLALDQANLALENLEVPVGCVIVENGKVISSGSNKTNATRNATRHAEMEAIDVLLREWQSIGLDKPLVAEKFAGCDLYVTCEPCIMCASALSILGIREVYFGCGNDKFGGCGSVMSLHESSSSDDLTGRQDTRPRGFKCTGGIMAEEAIALFRTFYEQGNPNAPKPHRPVRVDQQ